MDIDKYMPGQSKNLLDFYDEMERIKEHPRKYPDEVCAISDDIWEELIKDLDFFDEPQPFEKKVVSKDYGMVPPVIDDGVNKELYCNCDSPDVFLQEAGGYPYLHCRNCGKEKYDTRYSK